MSHLQTCWHCEKDFETKILKQIYCSTKCRQAAFYRQKQSEKLDNRKFKCPVCKENGIYILSRTYLKRNAARCDKYRSTWAFSRLLSPKKFGEDLEERKYYS